MIPLIAYLMANRDTIKYIALFFLKAISISLVLGFFYYCGYAHKGRLDAEEREKETRLVFENLQRAEAEKYAAERSLEAQLNVIADNAAKLNNEVENEAKKPTNVNCRFSVDGVRIINAAARNKASIQ